MNIYHILEEIENSDETFTDRISPRRKAIKNLFGFGTKVTLSALPLALGSLFQKAYSRQVPDKVIDILNFALSLEHLEYRFYQTGLNTSGLIKNKDNIAVIRNHEAAHVKLLTQTILSAGGTPVAEAKYDFTAKGTFKDVFSSYDTYLHVAQSFEDTGVRAYKGQAGKLDSVKPIQQTALQIHSTEARHAAHIRFARRMNGYNNSIKPWIIGDDNTTGTPYEPIYKGEDGQTQVLFNLNNINGEEIGDAVTSSFDEPLSMEDVQKIAAMFIVSP